MAERGDHEPYPRRSEGNQISAGDAESDGGTVDLSALQADDALLDALGSGDTELSGPMSQSQVDALLLAWRREVDAEPIGELVDTDTAMGVVTSARAQRGKRRHRFLVPLTSAAAVLLIGFTVVGIAARSAQPGDTLWGVTQVLYADHAQSVQAASTARKDLDQAKELLNRGNSDRCRQVLDRIGSSLNDVKDEDGKRKLVESRAALVNQLPGDQGQPPKGNPPPAKPHPGPGKPDPGTSEQTATQRPDPAQDSSKPEPSTPTDTSEPTDTSKPSEPTTSSPSTGGHGTRPGGEESGSDGDATRRPGEQPAEPS